MDLCNCAYPFPQPQANHPVFKAPFYLGSTSAMITPEFVRAIKVFQKAQHRRMLQGDLKVPAFCSAAKHPRGVVWVKDPFGLLILWVNCTPEEGHKYSGSTLNSNAPWVSLNTVFMYVASFMSFVSANNLSNKQVKYCHAELKLQVNELQFCQSHRFGSKKQTDAYF